MIGKVTAAQKHISNSHVFGPGLWWSLHIDSINIINSEDAEYYIKTTNRKLASIPCQECRNHALDYLSKNPVTKYNALEEGYFRWGWEFHNTVNRRLGKVELTYDEAKMIYVNPMYCTGDCGSTSKGIIIKPYIKYGK